MEKLILDSDVILNWLMQEGETGTGKELWSAPATILELGEMHQLRNQLSVISLLEIRFVLRRKMHVDHGIIESDLGRLRTIADVLTPTPEELFQANRLQAEEPLDPFDSILLSQAIATQSQLISREHVLLAVASKYVDSYTPEQYLERLL